MSDETPRRNECREWTCPLHGAENQRLDSELIAAAAEDDPDKIAAFKRMFPTAETYTVESSHMSAEHPQQGDPVTLRQIVSALGVTYKDEGIAIWLDAPQGYLHGQRAIDLCKTSEGRSVVAEAVERLDGVDPRGEQP